MTMLFRKLRNDGVCGHHHRTFGIAAKCGGYNPDFVQESADGFKTWHWSRL